jgi:hypothetical protein
MRYIKVDYYILQNKKKSYHHKKAMKITWSNDSDFSSNNEEEHVANMCLIGIENDNEVLFSDDEPDLSYNKLCDAFEKLYDEF